MTAVVSFQIANLLEKMTSTDKDFRFMATNDLMIGLQKDSIKLDDENERKVVKMLLKLLEDKNSEVQNLAVKCLGPLVNKVKDPQVDSIIDTLCQNMTSDNEDLRDVSSVALKTVIIQLPPSNNALSGSVCRRVTPQLVSVINSSSNFDVAILEGLEILSCLLQRFGSMLSQSHVSIEETLIKLLGVKRVAVRKRAIVALAHLVSICSQSLLDTVATFLIESLQQRRDSFRSGVGGGEELSPIRTCVNCVAAVSRAAGPRFGTYYSTLLQLLIEYCRTCDDDELRESCFQCFEALLIQCPKEYVSYGREVIQLCTKFLCHDPNYHYDDENEGGADADAMEADSERGGDMEVDSSGEEQDAVSDEEYSDDDDVAWKVRRAAAKCLEVALNSRHELLMEFYKPVGQLLISRFKEREENVKSDIFQTFMTLVRSTKFSSGAGVTSTEIQADADERTLLATLQSFIPYLVRVLRVQLRSKSTSTRQGCFLVLTEVLRVLPGGLASEFAQLVPGIQAALRDTQASSGMKMDTLTFLDVALSSHSSIVFQAHIQTLVPLAVATAKDPFYKVTAEALSVIQQLVFAIRPSDHDVQWSSNKPLILELYNAVYDKLKATDIDQEVKERAITCMGHFIATFADVMQKEMNACLPVLLDRMKNEVTRLTAIRAFVVIAGSAHNVPLTNVMPEIFSESADFLRKSQRSLRIATLKLLSRLLSRYRGAVNSKLLSQVLDELPSLVNESDMQIAMLAVELLTDVIRLNPMVVTEQIETQLTPIVQLMLSPLLEGPYLTTLTTFFHELLQLPKRGLRPSCEELKEIIMKPILSAECYGTNMLHKHAYCSISKCFAMLLCAWPSEAPSVIRHLCDQLSDTSGASLALKLFALTTVGEVGRASPNLLAGIDVKSIFVRSFCSSNEDVKTAASFALGGVTIGDPVHYLPYVLREIETQPKWRYMLLQSLLEIISYEASLLISQAADSVFRSNVDQIWKVLMANSSCTEEGVRNVVAECLGKLCFLDPNRLLPKLKDHLLENKSPLVRATLVTAMKFIIVDEPLPIDDLIKANIGSFVAMISDSDLNVRRVTLLTFNSAAHNKPALIRDLLDEFMPHLYAETVVRKDLIREVEMGPFRLTVDDGLDLRKAAFECMYTLLETCLERLDIFEFLNHIEDGLKDHYDIKILTYMMVIRLASLCPTQILQRMNGLVEPIKQTCLTTVKANSVKQEFEKMEELKRSALRAVVAFQNVPDADKQLQLSDFLHIIKTNPDLSSLYRSIQKNISNQYLFGSSDSAGTMEVDT